jgi:signal transduction histidine kinase
VAVLAIPVILAAVFGGLRVRTELKNASDYSSTQQRATVLDPAIAYLTATERLTLPTGLANQMGDGSGTPQAAYATAESNLKSAAAKADLTPDESDYVSALLLTGKSLQSGSGTGASADPATQLSSMNRLTTDLIGTMLNEQGTPVSRVQGLIQSLNGRLSLVKQQLLIESNNQGSSQLGAVWLAAEIGTEGNALDNLKSVMAGRRIQALITDNGTRLGMATSSSAGDLAATPRMFALYDSIDSSLLGSAQQQLAANASHSRTRALTDSAIILTALVASLLLALFVARALIVPLRKVRAGALEVANERLPETVARIRAGQEPEDITPIPVHSREELGQLARAVDDMHRQAVTLATGEAHLRAQVGAMFVTLSRRNTTLVNQQLALIESLEQDEEDPQRLEQLFSLDHLATRMRRTAESLVILGGTDGRTAGFEELSVSDIIHAAVSEVQDYQRVRIDAAPDRMVGGRVASDVVHLMAELIDNALSYSPPGSPVSIQASEEDGKVSIEIIDNGLGMAGDALAQANDSLKRGGEVTIDTARRMGLFVVSRLAEEHGLKVKLRRNSNGGGIIASITLPTAVLVNNGPVEHVSVLDVPEEVDEPVAPVLEAEPEEEYDPYLERIEEAIAAVTGLPRRRPGQVKSPAAEPAPAANVGMFDAAPELPAAFEPTELPGRHDTDDRFAEFDSLSATAASDAVMYDALGLAITTPDDAAHTESDLADVVTPDFGGEWTDPGATLPEASSDEPEHEPVTEPAAELDEAPAAELDEEPAEESADEPAAQLHEEPAEAIAEEPAEEPVLEPVAEFAAESVDEPAAQLHEEPAEAIAEEPAEEPAEESVDEPAAQMAEEPEAARWMPAGHGWASTSEPPVPAEPEVSEAPVRLQIRRPLSAAPAASALEGDYVDEGPSEDSGIFGQLRSNWLNDDEQQGERWTANEVDRAWTEAERVESADAESTTSTGLPVRRPGGRLLPGGVAQEPEKVVRDPEAIRNRLAAHAAGVSRGRAAAAASTITDDYANEETGPA